MEFIPVCEPYLNGNETAYVLDCMNTGWISSTGKYVKLFEEKFAEYCGAKHAICVSNGTVALHLAMVAMGIGEGDEVIIPDFTMIASAFAVAYTGAVPVFVDADKDTWNINTKLIEAKISSRTKAIMPVSIFGNPCDMDAIHTIAQKHKLWVIEDAAESHGATYKGMKTGMLADITCFSFFANKNITTGEGGMVVTNSDELNEKCRYFKNLCFPLNSPRTYMHEDVGFNYRMSNIHAAIGLAQVEKADEYVSMRVQNAAIYKQKLSNIEGIVFQTDQPDSKHVHWMNGIVIDPEKYGRTRDELVLHLKNKQIDTRLFFNGMHRQPALLKHGCSSEGDYTVSNWLADNGFYLPSANNLTPEQIDFICDEIIGFKL